MTGDVKRGIIFYVLLNLRKEVEYRTLNREWGYNRLALELEEFARSSSNPRG